MGVQAKVGNEEVAPLQPAQMRVRIDALSARVVSIEQAVASCERKLRVLNSRAIGGRSRKVCVPILIQVSACSPGGLAACVALTAQVAALWCWRTATMVIQQFRHAELCWSCDSTGAAWPHDHFLTVSNITPGRMRR